MLCLTRLAITLGQTVLCASISRIASAACRCSASQAAAIDRNFFSAIAFAKPEILLRPAGGSLYVALGKHGQTSNTFDSKHTLRYGGAYPGESEVSCVDDPDTSKLTYMNTEAVPVDVYFVVDPYSSSTTGGDFVLEWEISTPGTSPL